MKTVISLLAELKEKQIAISLDDTSENLRIRGELKNLTEDDKLQIRENKKEIITFLQERFGDTLSITPVAEQSNYPISDAQRRLWVLSQFKEGSVAYNMPATIRLSENVDVAYFRMALEATIDRHEILRTVFRVNTKGEIRQWILDRKELDFEIEYLDYRQSAFKDNKAKSYIAENSLKAFDLEKGPLLRAILIQLEEKEFIFYFNMHHIISDGWSMDVLYKDLLAHYDALKKGITVQLEALKIQYKDYATWQIDQLNSDAFKNYGRYWMNKLSGDLGVLNLKGANPRPITKTHKGRTVRTFLNKELSKKFKKHALSGEGTLFMSLTTMLNVLMNKYGDQEDIIIGTPIAGRYLRELENQIGFYVNALTLRTKLTKGDCFDDLYCKVKQTVLEAFDHQMYPFDRLVEELNQNRETSRSAIFDILVVLQNTGDNDQNGSIQIENVDDIVEVKRGTCIYDIKFEFQEQGDLIRLSLEYNTDIYSDEMIKGLIVDFKALSKILLTDVKCPLDAINYSISADQLIQKENDNTILNLFDGQVNERGTSVAIFSKKECLTYKQLNNLANRTAHFLIENTQLEKGQKVGLLLNKGVRSISSVFGVLKAGGAYIILTPTTEDSELLNTIEKYEISTLITEKEFLEKANRLQWISPFLKNYLCVDSTDVRSEQEVHENIMMSQDLWDHVGRRAEDDITGGGWLSSYTGQAIPQKEMEEYSMNAYLKLKEILHQDMRVLEIGCSTGITLRKIAPEVAFYYGTDLSPVILSSTQKMIEEEGLENVRLKQLVAHEISELEEENFDLIIINSVIQNFHGHNYLLDVLRKGKELLNERGRIFVGDVMDINKKAMMLEELEQFKKDNTGKGYTTKTDFSTDLFVSRSYFEDLSFKEKGFKTVQVSEKIATIENELTKFRYDVMIKIDKTESSNERPMEVEAPLKNQYDLSCINSKSEHNPDVWISADQSAFFIKDYYTDIEVKHGDVFNWFNYDADLKYDASQKWASFSFDQASAFETYGALLFGAELHLFSGKKHETNATLYQYLKDEQITICPLGAEELAALTSQLENEDGDSSCALIIENTLMESDEIWTLRGVSTFEVWDKNDITKTSFPWYKKEMSREEKEEILTVFNDTSVSYPNNKTVLDFFKETVEKFPNSIAIAFEDIEITFKELEERSSQLAAHLINTFGAKPGDLIGVRQERSEWLLVSILGIVKARCAYVPIDPNYPQERVDFIEADTNYKVCLDEYELNRFINSLGSYDPIDSKEITCQPGDLAYVIYTSGSTGTPKGVLIEHSSLINRLLWMKDDLNVSNTDILLQKTPITFDVSVWELFLPLVTGARLVFAKPDGHKDPAYLEKVIADEGISITHFVPSMLAEALENLVWSKFKSLRHVVCSGEVLPKKVEYDFSEKVPYTSLHNYYGPTEATVDVTRVNLTKNPTKYQDVSIGKPVENAHIYIVKDSLELQSVGEEGELLIGGVQVARGYLNRAELNAEKFIDSPFVEGERLYKTGDLAKWRPDGSIAYLGRKDDQVKIRGLRIELGEIEHALSRNQMIRRSVVVAREKMNHERELVAYITADAPLNAGDLRAELNAFLPDYMIPAFFVQLDELPLTTHGKVDRRALPDPEGMGMNTGADYVAPRNAIEEKLLSIWKDVLELERIGVKDDFFVLGGHSIKAVRLRNEYQKKLDVNISLDDLFNQKTIESQRKLIEQADKKDFVEIPALKQTDPGYVQGFPISDAQRRLWVLSQFDQGSVAYNMPMVNMLKGSYDLKCFERAIDRVIERHEILRTVFREDDEGQVKQWVLTNEEIGFEIDLKDFRSDPEHVRTYIAQDSFKPFDLQKGPLMRAALLQTDDNEYAFYYNIHHIISDGWSLKILTDDILHYYDVYRKGEESVIEPLRIQYKDYSVWQLEQVKSQAYQAHKEYWLDVFKGELPLIDLPTSKVRPRIKTNNGRGLRAFFDPETTTKLRKFSEDRGGSLFMGLLATWNVLMYRYTGQNDIIIGSSIAGREHADLENQIGFYSNTIASRNTILPEQSFNEFFEALKERMLKNYRHQAYPFLRFVEELKGSTDTGRNAVFDVMMFLQNNGEKIEEHQLDEVTINSITDQGYCPSKFDLNIGVRELGNIISFQVVFNTDVYEKEMIERLMMHYRQMVNALLDYPEQSLAEVNYLKSTEKLMLLNTFNDTTEAYVEGVADQKNHQRHIVELFEEQVEKTPDEIAVVYDKNQLTYREVSQLTNRLANYLLDEHAVKPNDLVGIMLNRSEWYIVAILGILKSGAAYVPIDPEDSYARKEHIIKDSEIQILLTEVNFMFDVDYYEGQIVALDVEFESDNYGSDKPNAELSSENLAYVIYTSGSTGQPKGVMNTAGALTDYTLGVMRKANIQDCKTFGLVSTLAADLGNTVVYPSLISGGKLQIISKEDILNAEKLEELSLDCVKMTPSHWKAIQTNDVLFTPEKCLILGGETFTEELYHFMKKNEISCNVYNHYGPTETTIGKLIQEVNFSQKNAVVPIGKPIGLNQVYILNKNLKLCPPGVTGEICISGVGLAKGYLNQEDETNKKFVENPYIPGQKLYKTGDSGKWLPTGEIVFVGRADDQVKIRGYRVELGEIENALMKQEDIEAAAVRIWTNKESGGNVVSENKLVAYIVSQKEQNTTNLRAGLRKILPEYMLPASYVEMDFLPLTSNGKVDRQALPNPDGLAVLSGIEYIAPRNEIEEGIVEIISYIANKPKNQISVYDNFFDLGISSLGLIKLYNAINRNLGINLQVVSVFEFSTVNALSEYILKGSEHISKEELDVEDVSNDMDEIIDMM